MIRTYRELRKLTTFNERYEYLRLVGTVGISTFGYDRYLNQVLYHSISWRSARDEAIIRDGGCDLGIPGYELIESIIVHHMNPITIEQIEHNDKKIFDPMFLICVSHATHMAIHYGDVSLLPRPLVKRQPGDTIPWR